MDDRSLASRDGHGVGISLLCRQDLPADSTALFGWGDRLAELTDGMSWKIQPEEDETLRKLKVNVRRAANELNLNVRYGDTAEGTLLVWKVAPSERKGTRGRPRKSSDSA